MEAVGDFDLPIGSELDYVLKTALPQEISSHSIAWRAYQGEVPQARSDRTALVGVAPPLQCGRKTRFEHLALDQSHRERSGLPSFTHEQLKTSATIRHSLPDPVQKHFASPRILIKMLHHSLHYRNYETKVFWRVYLLPHVTELDVKNWVFLHKHLFSNLRAHAFHHLAVQLPQ